ncbi:MAG: hypothetical protein LBU04_07395 [Christensenellaceae bacterium]|jgi:hypothetical protein|nr:hypothetical protein [Christensenellaceae bacterium]
MGAIIRQELDSFLRWDYFERLSEHEKQETLKKFLANEKRAFPTHATMLKTNAIKYKLPSLDDNDELALRIGAEMTGWTEFIYYIGCSLIHLTQLHNNGNTEPQLTFSVEERKRLLRE